MKRLIEFLKDENGNAAIQYGVLTTAITGAMVGPAQKCGEQLSNVFMVIAKAMTVH